MYKGLLLIEQTNLDGVCSLLGRLSRSFQYFSKSDFGNRGIRGGFFLYLTLIFLLKAWGNTFMVQEKNK